MQVLFLALILHFESVYLRAKFTKKPMGVSTPQSSNSVGAETPTAPILTGALFCEHVIEVLCIHILNENH